MDVWRFSPVALTLIVVGMLGDVAAIYTWTHRFQVGASAAATLLGTAHTHARRDFSRAAPATRRNRAWSGSPARLLLHR